jgi:hypothetical protein
MVHDFYVDKSKRWDMVKTRFKDFKVIAVPEVWMDVIINKNKGRTERKDNNLGEIILRLK